jgi:hypothetical protein
MTRLEIRRIFRQHRGESARLARELKIRPTTMSSWFHNRFNSSRIQAAALARAKEILESDAQRRRKNEQMERELTKLRSSAA